MYNSCDLSHGANCIVKSENYFYLTACLVLALQNAAEMSSLQNDACWQKKAPFAQEKSLHGYPQVPILHAGEYCENVTPTVSVPLIHAHENCAVK